jgi:hypothetical protein
MSSCIMAASICCRCSPGHAALGDAVYCTGTPPWLLKRPAEEVLCFPSSSFGLSINIAKGPCYGPLKLKLRHSNVYYFVVCLFVLFGLLLTTMDGIWATIVAGGQAQLKP